MAVSRPRQIPAGVTYDARTLWGTGVLVDTGVGALVGDDAGMRRCDVGPPVGADVGMMMVPVFGALVGDNVCIIDGVMHYRRCNVDGASSTVACPGALDQQVWGHQRAV